MLLLGADRGGVRVPMFKFMPIGFIFSCPGELSIAILFDEFDEVDSRPVDRPHMAAVVSGFQLLFLSFVHWKYCGPLL